LGTDINVYVEVQASDGTWEYAIPPEDDSVPYRFEAIRNKDKFWSRNGAYRYRKNKGAQDYIFLCSWWEIRDYCLFYALSGIRGNSSWGRVLRKDFPQQRDLPPDASPEVAKEYSPETYAFSPSWYTLDQLLRYNWRGDRYRGTGSILADFTNQPINLCKPEISPAKFPRFADFLDELKALAPNNDTSRVRVILWYD